MTEAIPPSSYGLSWIDIFLNILVSPQATFKQLKKETIHNGSYLVVQALITVILVSTLDGLRAINPHNLLLSLLKILCSCLGGIVFWLLLSATIGLTATCFGIPLKQAKALLVTLGWSFLPWIFVAPLLCFRNLWEHSLVILIPLSLWVVVLQFIAIKESYELKIWQTVALVLIVPLLLSVVQLMQFTQVLSATLGSFIS